MKNLKRTMAVIVSALFIVPVFAITGFAGPECQSSCSKSSVQANMTVVEKAMLKKQEDKAIRPCAVIRNKAAKQEEVNEGLAECCKSSSIKNNLSGIELALLAKGEDKSIRPCQFIQMRDGDDNSAAVKRTSSSDRYMIGSVYANLSDAEKADLRREESH